MSARSPFVTACAAAAFWLVPLAAQEPTLVVDLDPRPGPNPSSYPFANRHWIGSHDRAPVAPITGSGLVVFAAHVEVPGTPPRDFGLEPCVTDGVTAWLLADVAPGPDWCDPYGFVPFGGEVVFVADDRVHGHELWLTDGTTAGTRMLLDLTPGAAGTAIRDVIPAGSQVFFTVWDQTSRAGVLWRTDGTLPGTRPLWFAPAGSDAPADGRAVGSELYFRGHDAVHGHEPWVSDGVGTGTHLLADVRPGPIGSSPRWFEAHGTGVVFAADDGQSGDEPWWTDGSAPGTALLADVNPGPSGSLPGVPAAIGGSLFFAADDGVAGEELFELDDNDVVRRRTDINPAGDSAIGPLYPAGSNLFFRADPTGQFPLRFFVWSTATDTLTPLGVLAPEIVGAIGDSVLFATTEDLAVGRELWSSDGTPRGTGLVLDILLGRGESSPGPLAPVVPMPDLNGAVLFSADDGVHGREVWRSDGTAAGTGLVADLRPPVRTRNSMDEADVVAERYGRVYFRATDATGLSSIFVSDGGAIGTQAILRAPLGITIGLRQALPYGDGVVFVGGDDPIIDGLWVTDDTGNGAVELVRTRVLDLGVLGDRILFSAETATGFELWESDGTPAGTGPFLPLGTPQQFHRHAGLLWFSADDGQTGIEPWVSDGTVTGTRRAADLMPGTGSSSPFGLVTAGDRLFFWARDATGSGLFVVDPGSTAPRIVVHGSGRELTADGRDVWFVVGGSAGDGLWTSDGTAAGTREVMSFGAGQTGLGVAVLDDVVVFAFGDGVVPRHELWATDGTPAGARQLGTYGLMGPPRWFGTREAWFTAGPDSESTELWRTDGTVAGTTTLAGPPTLLPGRWPTVLTLAHGRLFLSAMHAWFGYELWTVGAGPSAQPLAPDGRCAARLDGTPPVLGDVARVDGWHFPPGGAAVVMVGLPHEPPLPLPGTCGVALDPSAVWTVDVTSTGAGSFSSSLAVPSDPALEAGVVELQAVTFPIATPLGFEVSSPLRWTLGN